MLVHNVALNFADRNLSISPTWFERFNCHKPVTEQDNLVPANGVISSLAGKVNEGLVESNGGLSTGL